MAKPFSKIGSVTKTFTAHAAGAGGAAWRAYADDPVQKLLAHVKVAAWKRDSRLR